MPRDKYNPDYGALYPGVHISGEALAVLKQSDRKMKYQEYDIKAERPVRDEDGVVIGLLPAREDSFERLLEKDVQFVSEEPTPEELFEALEEAEELRRCLDMLNSDERALIDALFFENDGQGVSESVLAKRDGVTQQAVSKRLLRILGKLEKYFSNFGCE